jgi:hypothetical protein
MGNSRNVKPGTARRWWPNYLSGLLSLLAGLAIVNLHNTWRADWRVIITVLGWLMTIGGIKYPSSADTGQSARRSGLSGVVSTTRASSIRLSAGLTAIPALLSNPCRNESGRQAQALLAHFASTGESRVEAIAHSGSVSCASPSHCGNYLCRSFSFCRHRTQCAAL